MTRKTAEKKTTRAVPPRKAVNKDRKDGLTIVESYLPAGSRQRAAAGIAAAAGGALLAAAVVGVGPAALAGAAGYLVYRDSRR